MLCIAVGVFPITQRFEEFVFQPPILDVSVSNCPKPVHYSFYLRDSKIVMQADFSNVEPDAPGIVFERGIAHDRPHPVRDDSYCNWVILDAVLEGEDGAFEPRTAYVYRGETGITGSELTYGAFNGGRWLSKYSEYLDNQIFAFDLNEYGLDEEFTLNSDESSACTRNQFDRVTDGSYPGNRIRINDRKFCISRTEIPHFNETREDIEATFESFLSVIDEQDVEGYPAIQNYADMSPEALSAIVEEKTDSYFESPTGIGSVTVEFTCNSCISPITRSFAFKVRGASHRVDEHVPISIYSDYQYIPEQAAQAPEQPPLSQYELVMADKNEAAIHIVRYKHRDGFFNLDFYQILSSIFIGIGITILIEISISANNTKSDDKPLSPDDIISAPRSYPANDHDPSAEAQQFRRSHDWEKDLSVRFDLSLDSAFGQTAAEESKTSPDSEADVLIKSQKSRLFSEPESHEDLRYIQAARRVLAHQKSTTSWLMRQMGVGANKANAWLDRMEKDGLIGERDSVGRRKVLFTGDWSPINESSEEYRDACKLVLTQANIDVEWLASRMEFSTQIAAAMLQKMEKNKLVGKIEWNGKRTVLKPDQE